MLACGPIVESQDWKMPSIAELEQRWRDAATTQAEAKQAFDDTVRQMKESGIDPDVEPAVQIVKANLEKSIDDYQRAATELLTEAQKLRTAMTASESDADA
jgi:hypothetical protein